MARNELFGIDVEEKEVKFDERVEKKEEKTKIGEVRISDKLTFKTGDDAEIKEFLKKVIDTEDYDEEFKLIVNEWIERKIEKTGECDADEILFAHRYKNNLEGHNKDTLKTKIISNSDYFFITNNGLEVRNYYYRKFCLEYDPNGIIRKYNGKIPKWALIPKISLKRIDSRLVLILWCDSRSDYSISFFELFKLTNPNNGGGVFTSILNQDVTYDSRRNNSNSDYKIFLDSIEFKFITKDDINKLLNDLLGMTKLVITERNSNNNVVDDFFR